MESTLLHETQATCPDCGETFKNTHGLKIHMGRSHRDGNGRDADDVTITKATFNASWDGSTATFTIDGGKKQTFRLAPGVLSDIKTNSDRAVRDVVDKIPTHV